jgi:hypothetical protein
MYVARVFCPRKKIEDGEKDTRSPQRRMCAWNGVGGGVDVWPVSQSTQGQVDQVSPVVKEESYFARIELSRLPNPAEVLSSSDGGVVPKHKVAGEIGLELSLPVPRRVLETQIGVDGYLERID